MLYQTHVRVHLGNIRANIEGIRKAVGPARKVLLAVKANVYGHNAVEVSLMAERSGLADWLGVATVPEGVELRKAGLRLPILKFSPTFPEEMAAAVENEITLAVCERSNIEALQAVCIATGKQARVHLKVDAGMGRVGVPAEDAPGLALLVERECPDLYLEGVFTHLPVSDEPAQAPYTRNQIVRFKDAIAEIVNAMGRTPELVHCSNSGAILGYEEGWLSMVRPGIMIYGPYYSDETRPTSIPLFPGLSFYTRLSFIKKIKAGTRIGYGLTWAAPEDTWIGTLPVGYADGFSRHFSNRGRVLVNGKSHPIVGRVCMDQSMIDLGPETDVRVGDEAVLIGRSGNQEITTFEWAQVLETNPHEVTCQINPRVLRLYDPYS